MTTLDRALAKALHAMSRSHLDHVEARRGVRPSAVPPIVAAKLDAEGYECEILEGGGSLLAVHRPLIVQVEITSGGARRGWQERLACTGRLAQRHGYRVHYPNWRSDDAYMVRNSSRTQEPFLVDRLTRSCK